MSNVNPAAASSAKPIGAGCDNYAWCSRNQSAESRPAVNCEWCPRNPETEVAPDHFAFSVRNKGKLKQFVWVWMERIEPKKPGVPQSDVIEVRVASLAEKDRILALNPRKFFTEPHYNGFPAVLVNLPAVTVRELEPLITEAWRCQAPKDLNA